MPRKAPFLAFSLAATEGTTIEARHTRDEEKKTGARVSPYFSENGERTQRAARGRKGRNRRFVANQLSTENEAPKGAPKKNNRTVLVPCFPHFRGAPGAPQERLGRLFAHFFGGLRGSLFIFLKRSERHRPKTQLFQHWRTFAET